MKFSRSTCPALATCFCFTLLSLVCLISVPAHACAQSAVVDLNEMQGTWTFVSIVDQGDTLDAEALTGAQVIFSGQIMSLVSPDGKERTDYSIALDPTKTPKQIEVTPRSGAFKGQANKGIYDLNGDILKICQPEKPDQPRPTIFESPEGSVFNLMTLKKSHK